MVNLVVPTKFMLHLLPSQVRPLFCFKFETSLPRNCRSSISISNFNPQLFIPSIPCFLELGLSVIQVPKSLGFSLLFLLLMASSKVMPSSSNSTNSTHHHHHNHFHLPPMISDFSPTHPSRRHAQAILPNSEISVVDAAGAIEGGGQVKSVDDVWREIVAAKSEPTQSQCKADEVMTLEDFLAKAGAAAAAAASEDDEVDDMKVLLNQQRVLFGFDPPLAHTQTQNPSMPLVNGNGSDLLLPRPKRRPAPIIDPLDKAAQQRQRRMIKNRESAARSRERKQAYQVELEALAVKLEEENEQLLREMAESTKERYHQECGAIYCNIH